MYDDPNLEPAVREEAGSWYAYRIMSAAVGWSKSGDSDGAVRELVEDDGVEEYVARKFVREHEPLLVDMAEIIDAAAPDATKDEVAGLLAGAMAGWFRRKRQGEAR